MNVSPPGISLFKAFSPFLISILQKGNSAISAGDNVFELFLFQIFKLSHIKKQYIILNLNCIEFVIILTTMAFLGQV